MKLVILCLFMFSGFTRAAETTLLIGDSHSVGHFGEALVKELGGRPKVARYAVSAASAQHWAKNPVCPANEECPFVFGYATPEGPKPGALPADFAGLAGLVGQYKQGPVLIALGTNDLNRCKLAGKPAAMKHVLELLKKVPAKRKCVWIGPPLYTKGRVAENCGAHYELYVNQLRETIEASACDFVDSREVKNPATGKPVEADSSDLVHFEKAMAVIWAKGVAAKISLR